MGAIMCFPESEVMIIKNDNYLIALSKLAFPGLYELRNKWAIALSQIFESFPHYTLKNVICKVNFKVSPPPPF